LNKENFGKHVPKFLFKGKNKICGRRKERWGGVEGREFF
jgi:hypothetical protein